MIIYSKFYVDEIKNKKNMNTIFVRKVILPSAVIVISALLAFLLISMLQNMF